MNRKQQTSNRSWKLWLSHAMLQFSSQNVMLNWQKKWLLRKQIRNVRLNFRQMEENHIHTVRLTGREISILREIAAGRTTPQIAKILGLSPETVKWYRKQLFAKFDAENAADLVRKAMEQKVL